VVVGGGEVEGGGGGGGGGSFIAAIITQDICIICYGLEIKRGQCVGFFGAPYTAGFLPMSILYNNLRGGKW